MTKETIAQLKEFVCYHRTLCDDAICRKEEGCFVNWVIEGLKELQHYKDLEEQGRLIELPCKVGDTVWEVALLPILPEDGMRAAYIIWGKEFELEDIQDFSKTVFLTKEEAEAKLKELKGE